MGQYHDISKLQSTQCVCCQLQFQSRRFGLGRRRCQPATAAPPAATGAGMPATSRCPPRHPRLCPTTPARTSCSRRREMMSARTSRRAHTSCLRTPYLANERWAGCMWFFLACRYADCIWPFNSDHPPKKDCPQKSDHLAVFESDNALSGLPFFKEYTFLTF